MRIVSLLPGATEMICLLGLEKLLVGVSHECDYPPSLAGLPKVTQSRLPVDSTSREIDSQVRELAASETSLFDLDLQMLEALQPELIVTQSLCDVCAVSETQVLECAGRIASRPQVIRINPRSLAQMLECVEQIGRATGVEEQTREVVWQLEQRIDQVRERSHNLTRRPRVVVLEWLDPLFTAGHWNPELVALAGGEELFGQAGQKSQAMEWNDLRSADPDVLIIACCGLTIDRTLEDLPALVSLPGFGRLKCIDEGQVYLNDGSQYFNRPGPRLVDTLEILAHALHPDLHPLPSYLEPAVRMKRENSR